MAITNAGLQFIVRSIFEDVTRFNANNSFIGVGDSSAYFDTMQTDLQGSQKARASMEPGYPKLEGNKITWKSVFGPELANFHWLEWGIFNASEEGVMLCRTVEDNSEKRDNQTWVIEVEITFITTDVTPDPQPPVETLPIVPTGLISMEIGSIDLISGDNEVNSNRLRSEGLISVDVASTYNITDVLGYNITVLYYDTNKDFLSSDEAAVNPSITILEGTSYIRLLISEGELDGSEAILVVKQK